MSDWGKCIRNGAICGFFLWILLVVNNKKFSDGDIKDIIGCIIIGIIIVFIFSIIIGWLKSIERFLEKSSYRSELKMVKKEADKLSKKLEQSPAVEYLTNKLAEEYPDSYYVAENFLSWITKNGKEHHLIFDQNGIPNLKPIIFDKLSNNTTDEWNTLSKYRKDNPNLHYIERKDIAKGYDPYYVIIIDQCILVGGIIAKKLLTKYNVSYEYDNVHWKRKYVIDKNW